MKFPKPEIYEQFFEFTPWGILIDKVISIILNEVPQNSTVLDIMCGTGYLLNEVNKRRNDLILEGLDLNNDFIKYAEHKYSSISFHVADIVAWETPKTYDLVLCTGGLHHLSPDKREIVLNKISHLLKAEGLAIFADPYIDDFTSESERKQAAAKIGYEYLRSALLKGPTNEIIEATIEILQNDVLELEFKTSLIKMIPVFHKYFKQVQANKTWQENESEFGDYYIICK